MYFIGTSKQDGPENHTVTINTVGESFPLNGFVWTATPPTQEGWYWANVNKGEPLIVKVGLFGTGETGTLWVHVTGERNVMHLDIFTHWLGPIPEPQPPTD